MTDDVTTIKGFPVLLKVSLIFSPRGEFLFAGQPKSNKIKDADKSNNVLSSSFLKYLNVLILTLLL